MQYYVVNERHSLLQILASILLQTKICQSSAAHATSYALWESEDILVHIMESTCNLLKRFGLWWLTWGGPRQPSSPAVLTVKAPSQRWHRCPWHSTRQSAVFCSCTPESGSGERCHITECKHTVQSKLRSVEVWFMTDPVRARWRDLSSTGACKSGLLSLINNCEILGGTFFEIIMGIICGDRFHQALFAQRLWKTSHFFAQKASDRLTISKRKFVKRRGHSLRCTVSSRIFFQQVQLS